MDPFDHAQEMDMEVHEAAIAAVQDNEGLVNEALMRLVQVKLFRLLMVSEVTYDLTEVVKDVAELGKASVAKFHAADYSEWCRWLDAQLDTLINLHRKDSDGSL